MQGDSECRARFFGLVDGSLERGVEPGHELGFVIDGSDVVEVVVASS